MATKRGIDPILMAHAAACHARRSWPTCWSACARVMARIDIPSQRRWKTLAGPEGEGLSIFLQ